MKKILVITAVVLGTIGFAMSGFAATYTKGPGGLLQTIHGAVVTLNQENKTVVIQDADDGREYVVGLWPDDFASLSQGQLVKVTLAQGSNLATSVSK